jgi:putative addiction module component (TIGR02574 family)
MMTDQHRRILTEALALAPTDRAELVEQLLASCDFPARAEIDAAWSTEAEDRLRAHERGDMEALPAKVVFRRMQAPPSQ